MNLQTMHDALDTLETSLQGEDHDTSERLMADTKREIAALRETMGRLAAELARG